MGKYCLSFRRIMPKNLSASGGLRLTRGSAPGPLWELPYRLALRARHVPRPHFQIPSAASVSSQHILEFFWASWGLSAFRRMFLASKISKPQRFRSYVKPLQLKDLDTTRKRFLVVSRSGDLVGGTTRSNLHKTRGFCLSAGICK